MRSSRSSPRCIRRGSRRRAIRRGRRLRPRATDRGIHEMNSAIQTAFDSWTPPVATIAALLAIAALYVRGFARVQPQMPARFARRHLAMFLAGIATILVAIASPLEALDGLLLQVHMTQHLILMLVSPALLLAGAPA